MNLQSLETELWEAADQLRANSKLTAAEYSMPVLGLIFLRHADNRFKTYLPEIAASIPPRLSPERREALIRLGFQGKAAVYLPEAARFERIAGLPRGSQVGEAIDVAMEAIEAEYTVLQGALPHGYAAFEPDLLAELVKIFDRPAIRSATGDVFGRIYEYFLNKFAMSGAQEGGEFFTPPSLVRLIVNVIEPDQGLVLDPACGSAGMFVQTGHFIEDVRHQLANDRVTFHGQEKSDTNTKLARMNWWCTGWMPPTSARATPSTKIGHLIGQCDFVMASSASDAGNKDRDIRAVLKLAAKLRRFSRGVQAVELLDPLPQDPAPTDEQAAEWQAALAATQAALDAFRTELSAALADTATTETLAALLAACGEVRAVIAQADRDRHAGQVALQVRLESLIPRLKSAGKALEARHKTWLALLDQAEKGLRARLSKSFDGRAVREARRALLAADARRNEAPTARDAALEALRQAVYFIHQVHWLHSRFPEAVFVAVPGLCKAVTRAEIAANDYSLTPGRYVGVAPASADDEDDFAETLREIHDELAELNDRAVELAGRIGRNLEALLA
jgi:type I restriction-modification system DNA methylase subunit